MGFDVVSTNVVWAMVMFGIVAGTARTAFDTAGVIEDASFAADQWRRDALWTRVGNTSASWSNATHVLTLSATNNGTVPVDTSELTLLVDGAVATGWTLSGLGGSALWLPGETITLTLSQTTPPARVLLVTDRGVAQPVFPPPYVGSIVLSPASASVAANATQVFTATVRDVQGRLMTGVALTWSASAGTMTALNETAATFTAPTLAQTGVVVSAFAGGVYGNATVDVVPGPVATVTVSPASVTLNAGATQQFTAVARDAYSNAVSSTFSWTVTNGSITSGGLYTTPSNVGSATVTATTSGVSGTANATIIKTVHVSAIQTFNGATQTSTFRKGDTVTTKVTIKDSFGAVASGVTVAIRITDSGSVQKYAGSAATDASGIATFSYTTPNGGPQGTWTDAVTSVSGASITYDAAANVVTSVTFQVTT